MYSKVHDFPLHNSQLWGETLVLYPSSTAVLRLCLSSAGSNRSSRISPDGRRSSSAGFYGPLIHSTGRTAHGNPALNVINPIYIASLSLASSYPSHGAALGACSAPAPPPAGLARCLWPCGLLFAVSSPFFSVLEMDIEVFDSWICFMGVCVCVLPVSVLANALHIFKNNTKTNKIRFDQWPCFTKLTGHFCFASFFFFLFPQRFSVLQFNFKCIYKIFPKCNWSKYFEGMRAMLENPSFSNPNTVLYGLWE